MGGYGIPARVGKGKSGDRQLNFLVNSHFIYIRRRWLMLSGKAIYVLSPVQIGTKLSFIALLRSDAISNALIASASENSPVRIGPMSILPWTSASTAHRNSS